MLTPSTGAVRRITFEQTPDRAASFSPDGRRIAFQSLPDGNAEIHVMAADGAGQRNVSNSHA